MFPDCRVDDYYNEDFLKGIDKEFLSGADWMLEQIVNLFEGNLDVYRGQLEYDGDIDIDKVLEKAKGEIVEMIKHWSEMERNMLITSLIESMEDGEFKEYRKLALEKNATSEKPKEYYDSRKYQCTGKKVFRE